MSDPEDIGSEEGYEEDFIDDDDASDQGSGEDDEYGNKKRKLKHKKHKKQAKKQKIRANYFLEEMASEDDEDESEEEEDENERRLAQCKHPMNFIFGHSKNLFPPHPLFAQAFTILNEAGSLLVFKDKSQRRREFLKMDYVNRK